ncbi:MAG: hypothetical protein HY940_05500 [Gammaproteobacteria bacterium]|nr:hypothetical protein [Gammaproteobacteria bacterium]
MSPDILTLAGVVGIGAFLLWAMLIMPQRKLPEEKERKPLYEERCSAIWRFGEAVLIIGGNIPIARISFYDDFFVVSLGRIIKIPYSEILSASFKRRWFSNSITIRLDRKRSLLIHPRNFKKVQLFIENHMTRD